MNNYNSIHCPYCNATLNLQNTFDNNDNVHICEACGNVVMDSRCMDNNICYCCKCNDILNNQVSWVGETGKPYRCFNCGAINYLPSADDVIEEESVEEYDGPLCPSCNGPLGLDYDKNKNINVCPNCGIEIKNLRCKDKFVWYCKKCGDLMNNQSSWRGEYEKIYRCDNCEEANELLGPKVNDNSSFISTGSNSKSYDDNTNYRKKESYDKLADEISAPKYVKPISRGGAIRTLASIFSWIGGIITAIIVWVYFAFIISVFEMPNLFYAIPIGYSIIDFIILVWRETEVSSGRKTAAGVLTLIFCSLIGGIFTICIPDSQLE